MARFMATLAGLVCSAMLASSAQAQTAASLSGGPANFFERLFGGLASPTARQVVIWRGSQQPGTVVISTSQRRLYYVLGQGQAIQ
jgi:lipoprotein-anchoring transpeptidase ErfK/SrfK